MLRRIPQETCDVFLAVKAIREGYTQHPRAKNQVGNKTQRQLFPQASHVVKTLRICMMCRFLMMQIMNHRTRC